MNELDIVLEKCGLYEEYKTKNRDVSRLTKYEAWVNIGAHTGVIITSFDTVNFNLCNMKLEVDYGDASTLLDLHSINSIDNKINKWSADKKIISIYQDVIREKYKARQKNEAA